MKTCLFGLGRIGLPIALVCADSGHEVVAIDINKDLSDVLSGINSNSAISTAKPNQQ